MSWEKEAARAAKAAKALKALGCEDDMLHFDIPSADANLDELELDQAMVHASWEGAGDWRQKPKAFVLEAALKGLADALEAKVGLVRVTSPPVKPKKPVS